VSVVKPKVVTVFTHGRPEHTIEAVERLMELAGAEAVEVRVPREELEKHALEPRAHAVLGCDPDDETDVAIVFGGDGTVFTALRAFAGRGVPVFAFNYGTIGFLATFERHSLEEGLRCALTGDFDVLSMPALAVDTGKGKRLGVNDISFHRRPESRVAELGYSVAGEELGQVRCDGLVAATPVGSTGYNLANGGPVLAWGVEGFVVSFIAPHTLTARALVVAPDDVLTVENRSDYEAVDVTTDGRPVDTLEPGDRLDVRFEHDQVLLAQVPGTSFYHRFREKFGRLAS
jgi:NAD+ kinase